MQETFTPEEAQRIHDELLASIEKVKPFLPVGEAEVEPTPLPVSELQVGDIIDGHEIGELTNVDGWLIARYLGQRATLKVGDSFEGLTVRSLAIVDGVVIVERWAGQSQFGAQATIPAQHHRRPA